MKEREVSLKIRAKGRSNSQHMYEGVGQQFCIRLHGPKSSTSLKLWAATPQNTQKHPTGWEYVKLRANGRKIVGQ